MPVTPNILLQASRQAKTQAASANPPALTAEPGDKAASFAHVYANQAQNKPYALADASVKPVRDKTLGRRRTKRTSATTNLPPRNRWLPMAANPCPPTNRCRLTTRLSAMMRRRLRDGAGRRCRTGRSGA